MAILPIRKNQNQILTDFVKEYRVQTLTYLAKRFSLNKDDCEDVFQESCIILHDAVRNGVLDNLTSSLFTYFIGICRNKAHEQLRYNVKINVELVSDSIVNDEDEYTISTIEIQASKILSMIEDDEQVRKEKVAIVEKMVESLPSPCKEILWSFYRDALSMKDIANMFGYKSESVAKVTKHRCQEKFRTRYEEMTSQYTL